MYKLDSHRAKPTKLRLVCWSECESCMYQQKKKTRAEICIVFRKPPNFVTPRVLGITKHIERGLEREMGSSVMNSKYSLHILDDEIRHSGNGLPSALHISEIRVCLQCKQNAYLIAVLQDWT